jgi:hypothetical protein
MDIKSLLNSISDVRKNSAGNLTIGDMLTKLDQFNDDETVTYSNGAYFDGSFGSYRGYYEDMYLGFDREDQGCNTVGHLKTALESALSHGEMTGYKGGEFSIEEDTLLWSASYGCIGDMVVDVLKLSDKVYVITKEDEF